MKCHTEAIFIEKVLYSTKNCIFLTQNSPVINAPLKKKKKKKNMPMGRLL